MSGRAIISISLAAALVAGLTSAAAAQAPSAAPSSPVQQQPRDPNMPAPQNTVPEKIDSTGSTNTLSEKLERSDGVIKPPDTGAADMRVKPPVANPGTTPVIPPPGSPGGNPRLDPK